MILKLFFFLNGILFDFKKLNKNLHINGFSDFRNYMKKITSTQYNNNIFAILKEALKEPEPEQQNIPISEPEPDNHEIGEPDNHEIAEPDNHEIAEPKPDNREIGEPDNREIGEPEPDNREIGKLEPDNREIGEPEPEQQITPIAELINEQSNRQKIPIAIPNNKQNNGQSNGRNIPIAVPNNGRPIVRRQKSRPGTLTTQLKKQKSRPGTLTTQLKKQKSRPGRLTNKQPTLMNKLLGRSVMEGGTEPPDIITIQIY